MLISRHVSLRKARLLARFAETKLLNDIWTPVKDGVLRDEIHGRFRNKRLYNIFFCCSILINSSNLKVALSEKKRLSLPKNVTSPANKIFLLLHQVQ